MSAVLYMEASQACIFDSVASLLFEASNTTSTRSLNIYYDSHRSHSVPEFFRFKIVMRQPERRGEVLSAFRRLGCFESEAAKNEFE